MKLNTKVAVDSQMVFQTWTSSAISHFSFRHFRKQNKKQVTAFICINIVFALPCQSALHKWCWGVSPGPCILWEQNCGVPDFGKKCRCGVGQSHRSDCWSCSKRSRTPRYCGGQTSYHYTQLLGANLKVIFTMWNWKYFLLKQGMEMKVFFHKDAFNVPKIQSMFYLNSVDTNINDFIRPAFPLLSSSRLSLLVGIWEILCAFSLIRHEEKTEKTRGCLFPAGGLLQPCQISPWMFSFSCLL